MDQTAGLAEDGFLTGGGSMGARVRQHDWSATPLGPIDNWPQSLRTAVSLVLNSKFPKFLACGPELTSLYNDAYRPVLGLKPEALGRPFRHVWAEAWDVIGPIAHLALAGEASYFENLPLVLEHKGYAEQTWWTFSYSPVRDESGGVGGVLCTVHETTAEVKACAALKADQDHLRALFHQAPGFMCVLSGPEHVFELTNAAFQQITGGRDLIGMPVHEALPEAEGQTFYERLDLVYRTGEPFVGRGIRLVLRTGPEGLLDERFADFVYQPITAADGRVTGIFVEGYDVTERVRAERGNAHLAAIVSSSADSIVSFGLDGTVLTWNPGAEATFGYTAEEVIGREVTMLMPEDRRHEALQALERVRGGATLTYETVRRRRDGTRFMAEITLAPMRNAAGAITGVSGIARDVTDRRRAEEQGRLLINELNHRVKNTLATVQAIASQTLRNAHTVEEAREAFEGRLIALSRAHDVLTREAWEGASLREIVAQAVEPYRDASEHRLHVAGPDIRVPPRMALALAMALQELATNAVKYGALSNDRGEIRIAWSVDSRQDPPRLDLCWQECSGPSVEPPSRRGFGSRLIERSLAYDLDGEVSIAFEAAGVVCTISAPLPGPGEGTRAS